MILEIAFVVGKGLGAYLPDFVMALPLPCAGFEELLLWRLGCIRDEVSQYIERYTDRKLNTRFKVFRFDSARLLENALDNEMSFDMNIEMNRTFCKLSSAS